jgi:anti-sigma factor RsiW
VNICKHIQSQFSDYLDGAVTGNAMQAISAHFEVCPACRNEFSSLRAMQTSLSHLGPAKAPAHLAQRLRAAIAQERARRQHSLLHGLAHLWHSTSRLWNSSIGPIVYRAAAGAASTAVLMGAGALLLGALYNPEPLVASNDQPIGDATSPHFLYSSVPTQPIHIGNDGTLLVEAYVNRDGHIYDYQILSGPDTPQVRSAIDNQLLFSVYEPARFYGQPVRGRVLISFAGISVHG